LAARWDARSASIAVNPAPRHQESLLIM